MNDDEARARWREIFPDASPEQWWIWHRLWDRKDAKPCTGCAYVLAVGEFKPHPLGFLGRTPKCRPCCNRDERFGYHSRRAIVPRVQTRVG